MKIFKYPIPRNANEYGVYTVYIPSGSQILSAAIVNREIVLYTGVPDPDATMTEKPVQIVGTGKELAADGKSWKFLATLVQEPFVWHIFV